MDFSPEKMRARYAELTAKGEEIRAKAAPMREARDAFANEARDKELAMNAEIAEVEAGLGQIDNERALISRALGGKVAMPVEGE